MQLFLCQLVIVHRLVLNGSIFCFFQCCVKTKLHRDKIFGNKIEESNPGMFIEVIFHIHLFHLTSLQNFHEVGRFV